MLDAAIPKDLDELLEDGSMAASALLSEACGVVVVTIYGAFVLVVGVGGAEDGRANGAGEVLNVVLAVEGGDVGAAKGAMAGEAEEVETAEVVCFAERVLIRRVVRNWKELGCDNLLAVLRT